VLFRSLFAADEGRRILPFGERDGAVRLLSPTHVEGLRRAAIIGLEEVLAGARERLEADLGEEGASLSAIACAVDGGRGALVRIRLRTAEEEHRARAVEVVEAMQLGMYVLRLEDKADPGSLRYVYGNPATEAITGVPPSEVVGVRLSDTNPTPAQREMFRKYAGVIEDRQGIDTEYQHSHARTGRDAHYAVKAFPLSGQTLGVIFEDVTERRNMEESLRKTSQFLDSILDNIPIVIFIKEAHELRYIHVNRYMEEVFDGTAQPWVGKTDFEVFPREVAELFVRKDLEVFEGRKIVDIPEEVVPLKDGKSFIAHTRKIPLFDEDGKPLYLIGLSEDITEHKTAEEARRREMVLLETQTKLVELVRQLSTPLLPLAEGVLVAPLVGQMDEARGQHFMEALLAGIQQFEAKTVLIDITGVPSMDAAVAEQLSRATQAARLLGTETALVGVSPQVAKTIVELGVDFRDLVTYADLRAGLRAAAKAAELKKKARSGKNR